MLHIFLAGAPYPALFDAPAVTADGGVYDLSWRVNCSTPLISYELEFREMPHGNWLSLNVPGKHGGGGRGRTVSLPDTFCSRTDRLHTLIAQAGQQNA